MRPQTRVVVALLVAPAGVAAQGRDLGVLYGRWYQGNRAATYELRTDRHLGGVFSHGFVLQVLVHDSLGRRRAFYGAGWELHALRRQRRLGPYFLVGSALGLSTDTLEHAVAVTWNIGAGVEWRPVQRLGLAFETRYRLEDRGPRGFWRRNGDSRGGVSTGFGLSVSLGGGGTRAPRAPRAAPTLRTVLPAPRLPAEPSATITGNAAAVVQSALLALGSPYQWGGTAENGFDCSGLVQYAYGRHGIRLPRMSRDQARAGTEVAPAAGALAPGDILLFAARPGGGVTHVGMYVGEEKFIHSSSTGVKLSRLEARDPDGAWWVARWVGARRVIP